MMPDFIYHQQFAPWGFFRHHQESCKLFSELYKIPNLNKMNFAD